MVVLGFLKIISVLGQTCTHMKAAGRHQASIDTIKKSWASKVLSLLSVELKTSGAAIQATPAIFVGNHVSYLDIPLLMRTVPDISFVAKKELSSWPIFGEAARKAGTVFVDRSSLASRMQVRKTLREALLEKPRAIAIFPSGTTSLHEEKPWKRGAFRIAQETSTPIQAFRIRYKPLRTVAFIDDDSFLLHLYGACTTGTIQASIEFAEPELVLDPDEACTRWRKWCMESQELPHELSAWPHESQA